MKNAISGVGILPPAPAASSDYIVMPTRGWKGANPDLPVVQLLNSSPTVLKPRHFSRTALARLCAVVGLIAPIANDELVVAASAWADAGIPVILPLAVMPQTRWSHGDMLDLVESFSVTSPGNNDNPGGYRFVNVITRSFNTLADAMHDATIMELIHCTASLHQFNRLHRLIH